MLQARLIPVSGIGSDVEAEQRAASAFLAVLGVVRDLSSELLSPLGASRAQRATVECFTEVVYSFEGKRIRPDGLIRVSYGTSAWSALVEVKTGTNTLEVDQLNTYWDLARANSIDQLLTISNEIAATPGAHPTPGLKVRSTSKVPVSHLSWSRILTSAIRLRDHKGVSDPEQAWILSELIRYLEHPSSGALAFNDMGPNWVAVRDAARSGTLNRKSEGIDDLCARWDQLLQYIALRLSSETGSNVTPVLPKQQRDPRSRQTALIDSLAGRGIVDGALRIPNTAGDLEVVADLRGQTVMIATEIMAPQDRGAKGRVSWLVGQLKDAPTNLTVEAYAKNVRTGIAAPFATVRDDRVALLGPDKKDPHKFRLVIRTTMGAARKAGTRQSFIESVIQAVGLFYGGVLQDITPWQPPAPRLSPTPNAPASVTTTEERPIESQPSLIAPDPPRPWWEGPAG
jgi:hypothetical protein